MNNFNQIMNKEFNFTRVCNLLAITGVFAISNATFLNSFFRLIVIYPVFAIWVYTCTVIDKTWLKRSEKCFFLLFCMVILCVFRSFQIYSSEPATKFITHVFLTLFWPIAFLFYCDKKDMFKKLLPVILVVYIVSAYFTVVGNITYPEASRLLTGTSNVYASTRALYRSKFIGGYDFIYAVVFFIPAVFAYVSKAKYKIVYIAALILLCVTIYYSAFATAIIFTVIFLFLQWFRPKSRRQVVFFSIILLVLVSVLYRYIPPLFNFLGEKTDSHILIQKADEMTNAFSDAEVGELTRVQLYKNAWLNFLERPIFGTFQGNTTIIRESGHSETLGYLEQYGILSIVYFGYLFSHFKKSTGMIKNDIVRYRLVLYYILFFVFISIDILSSAYALGTMAFFVGPMMFLISDVEEGEDAESTLVNEQVAT